MRQGLLDEDINAGLFPTLALSLYAPWAWAILHGGKDVENRVWKPNPKHVGKWFWIHVSRGNASGEMKAELGAMKAKLSPDVCPPTLDECMAMRGKIVGCAKISGIALKYHGSRWFVGKYGILLEPNPYKITPWVPALGHQRFWQVEHTTLRDLAEIAKGASFA